MINMLQANGKQKLVHKYISVNISKYNSRKYVTLSKYYDIIGLNSTQVKSQAK